MYSKLDCDNTNVITLASCTMDITRITLFHTQWDVKKDQESKTQYQGKNTNKIENGHHVYLVFNMVIEKCPVQQVPGWLSWWNATLAPRFVSLGPTLGVEIT